MYEVNVNFEVENEIIENLATAVIECMTAAAIDGIVTNQREGGAYSAGYLAAIALFTDTTTAFEVLEKMKGKE